MTGMTGSSANSQMVTGNSMGSPFDNILSGGGGSNDWNSGGGGLGGPAPSQDPLSNLMDSVNSLDPLNSMGKSLNEQVQDSSASHIQPDRFIFIFFCGIVSDELAGKQRQSERCDADAKQQPADGPAPSIHPAAASSSSQRHSCPAGSLVGSEF